MQKNASLSGMCRIPIIHDGDHGSDDFLASLVALGRNDILDLLGITTCHGNVSVRQATRNACAAVDIAGRGLVAVIPGAGKPWKMPAISGDDAFGKDGLGGVELAEPATKPLEQKAHCWMIETLQRSPVPVTLCVTGPMTNVAHLLAEVPQIRHKIAKIVAMGGCLGPLGPFRRTGNITPFAEFNFYMDPDAAEYVIQSGVPMALLPMDATHQLVLSDSRKSNAAARWQGSLGNKLIQMLSAAEKLDRTKFDLDGTAIHDLHVMVYLLAPELYRGRVAGVAVNTDKNSVEHGRLSIDQCSQNRILLIENVIDPDAVFELVLDAVHRLLMNSSATPGERASG
jgi:purine nucleosidase